MSESGEDDDEEVGCEDDDDGCEGDRVEACIVFVFRDKLGSDDGVLFEGGCAAFTFVFRSTFFFVGRSSDCLNCLFLVEVSAVGGVFRIFTDDRLKYNVNVLFLFDPGW